MRTIRWLSLILGAVVLTRLPFLWMGYGADADSWLAANAAASLLHTGTYFPSRLPGFPLHEIISSPFVVLGGAVASNGATLLVTIAAVIVWFCFVERISRSPKILVLCLAFAPVVWQHSAETIDYVWSLLFILLSLLTAEKKHLALSGICVGIAAGFRSSNIVAIVPLITFLYLNRHDKKDLFMFTLSALATASIAFLPLILKYGAMGWIEATQLEMSDIHPRSLSERLIAFGYRSIYSIGLVTAVLATVILWSKRKELVLAIRSHQPLIVTSVIGIATFLLLFLWLPLERAYLLPALPMLLLLLDRFATKSQIVVFTCCLIASGIVNIDVIKSENRRAAGLNVHWGMVIEEWQLRKKLLDEREQISSLSFSHKAIVMTAGGPTFWLDNDRVEPSPLEPFILNKDSSGRLPFNPHHRLMQKKDNHDILFVMYLLQDELGRARLAGYTVYCPRSARKYIEPRLDYSLERAGIRLIEP